MNNEEKLKEIERLKEEIDLKRQFLEAAAKTHGNCTPEQIEELWFVFRQEKELADLNEEISSLKSQLEAKAVDMEELRNEFYELAGTGNRFHNKFSKVEFDKVFNFFLPYLQPGKSDVVEFAEWIEDKCVHRHARLSLRMPTCNLPEWESNDWLIIWSVDNKQFVKTTEELYQEFLKHKYNGAS